MHRNLFNIIAYDGCARSSMVKLNIVQTIDDAFAGCFKALAPRGKSLDWQKHFFSLSASFSITNSYRNVSEREAAFHCSVHLLHIKWTEFWTSNFSVLLNGFRNFPFSLNNSTSICPLIGIKECHKNSDYKKNAHKSDAYSVTLARLQFRTISRINNNELSM